jgi:myo-inositol-1(or 4)-monophosphatase
MSAKMQPKEFALDMARKAGEVIRTNFTMGVMKKDWKGDHSPLTVTDQTINAMVMGAVTDIFPNDSLIAEEGSVLKEGSEYVWVCDPVDGTFPFSHGIPICVFALALVKNGEPVLGVIYDPFQERMYFAEKGKGAFLNDRQIHVAENDKLERTLIGLGNWKNAYRQSGRLVETLMAHHAAVMNLGSILYMGMLVASGEFSATIFPGRQPHDNAALKILVEEAGGKMTSLSGEDQRYDQLVKGHIAANHKLHEQLVKIVQEANS